MITMRQLEAFRAVIETGSVTKASQRLHLSQPSVSKLVTSLERVTGLPLFRRERRRLVPTPEAGRIYEEAQRLFVGLSEVTRVAEELRALETGGLAVGSLVAMGRSHVPRIVGSFLRQHRNVTMSVQVRSSARVVQWAIAQQLDVGIAQTAIDHPAIETELLCTVAAVCVLPADHPLAGRRVIAPEDLRGETFISFSREGRMRHTIDQLFETAGVLRDLRLETFNSDGVCSLVVNGAGVSIVDPFSAENFVAHGLVVRPFLPAIPYEFKLVYPRYKERSLIVRAFVDRLRKDVGRIAARYDAQHARAQRRRGIKA